MESLMRDEAAPLRIRLFRLIGATTFVLCLFVILPMNLMQDLPGVVTVADVALGLLGGYCCRASLRGRHYFFGFFAVLVALLNPIWFLNAGAAGSITYLLFPIVIYPLVIFRGWRRIFLTVALVVNFCGLLVFEYFHPSFTVAFKSPADRVIDLTTGAFASALAVAALTWLIVTTYDREHQRLTTSTARLAASEQNYREIFNATSDALVIRDPAGRAIDLNERMCALFGYDRAALLGLPVAALSEGTGPYSGAEAADRIRRTLTEGPQQFVWRSRRSNGECFWSEVAMRAGEIAGEKRLIVSLRDIDDRVRAGEALRTQEERLRLTLEASRQGWFDIDVRTGEGRASAEYARIVGLPPEDFAVSVQEWMSGVHPDDRADAERAFRACVATGDTHTLEYRRKTVAGEWKWIRSTGRIVAFDAAGKAVRMVGTHADITERKALEARLLHSQRLESVATLAGGVAHDLNNILTPMLMAGCVLREKLAAPQDRELLASLESGARRGAMIVRQLMEFSQRLTDRRVRVELAPVIQAAARLARANLAPSIAVVESLPPGLWTVTADPDQLRQVLDNLCVNAREAMPHGGTLTLSASNTHLTTVASTINPWGKAGAFVQIAVADTGRGIPREVLPRIFDPFFTTKGIGEGPGLGLSTVHGIVNGHGGSVTVESEPGLGTTFKVFLPASVNPGEEKPA
jgi:PAS domain S-box-containing protein